MKNTLDQLLKEWQTFLPKMKNKLSQLAETISQKNTWQTQLTELTQQKNSLQNQVNQLSGQVFNQLDKNLLSQCVNALNTVNSNWNIFTNWQSYHTWFNNSSNINNSGAKTEVKNVANYLRNYLNTSKSIIDQKNNIQNQLNEANRKLEVTNKENTENEKVLNQIFTEMQQLAGQLN